MDLRRYSNQDGRQLLFPFRKCHYLSAPPSITIEPSRTTPSSRILDRFSAENPQQRINILDLRRLPSLENWNCEETRNTSRNQVGDTQKLYFDEGRIERRSSPDTICALQKDVLGLLFQCEKPGSSMFSTYLYVPLPRSPEATCVLSC